LIEEIAVKMMQSDGTTRPSTHGLDRHLLGLALGALVLGSTLGSPVSAEPFPKQADYREQQERAHGSFRTPRDTRQAQPAIRYESGHAQSRDHLGPRSYPAQEGYRVLDSHRAQDHYRAQDGYRAQNSYRAQDGDIWRHGPRVQYGYRAQDGYRGQRDYRGPDGHRGRDAYRMHEDYVRPHRYPPRDGYAVGPSYRFGPSDRAFLHHHYRSSLRSVRMERRPYFGPGYTIEPAYRPHVVELPSRYRRHLPPPPYGYQVGYYEGYSVVYDPVTFTILSVLDLMIR
jgi:hypothetical protein